MDVSFRERVGNFCPENRNQGEEKRALSAFGRERVEEWAIAMQDSKGFAGCSKGARGVRRWQVENREPRVFCEAEWCLQSMRKPFLGKKNLESQLRKKVKSNVGGIWKLTEVMLFSRWSS